MTPSPTLPLPLLAEIERELTRRRLQELASIPLRFVEEGIQWRPGEGVTSYQREVLEVFPQQRCVAVRSPHGTGKTALAAWIVLWFAATRSVDWKAPTTASAWRQLTKYLWPEIHKWYARLRPEWRQGVDLQVLSMKTALGEAFALASHDPALIEGAHGTHLLYVFDEAKAIPTPIWDAAEGAFAGGETAQAYALAISTPGAPVGRFYEIHSRKPGLERWWSRHIKLDEAIRAGRVTREWAEEHRRLWGEDSPLYQNRVLGEFAVQAEDAIIPLAWVEAAMDRWREFMGQEEQAQQPPGLTSIGVDVGGGIALGVSALRVEDIIVGFRREGKGDTMATAGEVLGLLQSRGGVAIVDAIGIGLGLLQRVQEQGGAAVGFVAGAKTEVKDRSGQVGFVNLRAAAWWGVRERLDPAFGSKVALPPDDLLLRDLTTPLWRMTSLGKIQVEEKEAIRRRLGRSTDTGDAVVMAFADILVLGADPRALVRGSEFVSAEMSEIPEDEVGGFFLR